MRSKLSGFGGQAGLAVAGLGLAFVFLGWNGAASYDRVPAQFPYLISGGILGLGLIVFGAALVVVQNQRQDRARLEAAILELRQAVADLAAASSGTAAAVVGAATGSDGFVVTGGSSYHRPTCRLVDGRGPLPLTTPSAAEGQGLAPCRVCSPDQDELPAAVAPAAASPARRSRKATARSR